MRICDVLLNTFLNTFIKAGKQCESWDKYCVF